VDINQGEMYGQPDAEEEGLDTSVDVETPAKHPADLLREYINTPNIAATLEKDRLNKIGMDVTRGYDIDKASRADWERQTKTAMDLAMQIAEEKSWPWPKAANVKYPLITTAAIQFNARAYPAIVKGGDVVKGEVNGPDPDGTKAQRAERIGQHMSYQLLNVMEDWDEDTDKLLLQMAIVGCAFRKTYFDSALGRNCSDLVAAKDLVYNHAVPFRKLRRITHLLNLYKNDVTERIRSGIFEPIELGVPSGEDSDEDGHFEFLEQHCWYDLDDDGYKEPYIVTVRKETSEVVRIVARYDEEGIYLNAKGEISKIEPVSYFTKFPFMPNPDGGSYDVGMGILLNPINETVNTVLNQMLDAGTLQNIGGGFIGSGMRMKSGSVRMGIGEYKPVDNKGGPIRDNIYHMQHPGPSTVLFQLLGMLIEAAKDISSVKDILTGEQQVNQTATTTMALIEQGQKVFSAIYKRVHRSLKDEFRKLYRLNKLYMQPEEYFRYQDKSQPILLQDYQGDDTDVVPVSDPNMVSDAQHLTQAEALIKFAGDPFFNQMEIRKRYLQAIKVESPETLLQEPPQQGPDPKMAEIEAKNAALHVKTTADAERSMAETHLLAVKAADTEASALLKLAQAEAQALGNQMQMYVGQFQAMMQQFQGMIDDQGRVSGVEGSPADQTVPPVPDGLSAKPDGVMGGGGVPGPDAQSGGGSAEPDLQRPG
jgi:chaperonin GroES